MVVSTFSVSDKNSRERFFEESFLLANVKPDIVLEMSFLTMSNINIDFQAQDSQWRFYITRNIIPTTKIVELIGKKEFAIATLELKYDAFIVYLAALSIDSGDEMYPCLYIDGFFYYFVLYIQVSSLVVQLSLYGWT